ncbi:MAG: lycopene cyclase domain-containing protein [Anaerolineae bacterium]
MPERFTYLALELGWALPPIILQWLVGWPYLQRERRVWLLAILLPTLYLAVADSTALGLVWTISPQHSLGIAIGNVPLEEIAFFLVTNTLVVQSVLLARHSGELVKEWSRKLKPPRKASRAGSMLP